jgi:zona occludens toxin (predicted ATPase)
MYAVINLLTGVPGAGKTYYVFAKVILKALKENKQDIYLLNFEGTEQFINENERCHDLNWMRLLFDAHVSRNKDLAREILNNGTKNGTITDEYRKFFEKKWEDKSTVNAVFQVKKITGTKKISYPTIEDWCKKGSILLIDEAQAFFGSAKECDFYEFLCVARHSGYNICFITQNSLLLAVKCRKPIGSHIYLDKPFGIHSRAFRFNGVEDDSNARKIEAKAKNAQSREILKYDKKIFKMYKSSEQETRTLDIPWKRIIVASSAIFMLLICIIVLLAMFKSLQGIETNKPEMVIATKTQTDIDTSQKKSKKKDISFQKEKFFDLTHRGIGDTFCDVSVYDIQVIGVTKKGNSSRFLMRFKVICHTPSKNEDGNTVSPIRETYCQSGNVRILKRFGYKYKKRNSAITLWRKNIRKTKLFLKETGEMPICSNDEKRKTHKNESNSKVF